MSTANPARPTVAAALTRPGWNTISVARPPAKVAGPTALVWTGELTRSPAAALVESTVEVWLVLDPTEVRPELLEDRLDDFLTKALTALEDAENVYWTRAVRAAIDGTPLTGWHLFATVHHTITKE